MAIMIIMVAEINLYGIMRRKEKGKRKKKVGKRDNKVKESIVR